MSIEEHDGLRVLRLDPDGPVLATDADTSDLFGNAWYEHVDVVVVPVARLHGDFFVLSSRLAGEVLRTSVNYDVTLAVLGDISVWTAASEALRDFVAESNRGRHAWFAPDDAALTARLATHPSRGSR